MIVSGRMTSTTSDWPPFLTATFPILATHPTAATETSYFPGGIWASKIPSLPVFKGVPTVPIIRTSAPRTGIPAGLTARTTRVLVRAVQASLPAAGERRPAYAHPVPTSWRQQHESRALRPPERARSRLPGSPSTARMAAYVPKVSHSHGRAP